MTRWHITLDIPDNPQDHDPWGLLGYLTDAYSDPTFIGPNDEHGIRVTITEDTP